jgi:hypothetical protein
LPSSVTFGGEALRRLLALPERPTAVVTGTVQHTLSVLESVLDLDVSVPDELSIVGFGDELGFRLWGPGAHHAALAGIRAGNSLRAVVRSPTQAGLGQSRALQLGLAILTYCTRQHAPDWRPARAGGKRAGTPIAANPGIIQGSGISANSEVLNQCRSCNDRGSKQSDQNAGR